MADFNSAAPAWNDIPPLKICGAAKPVSAGAISIATTEGPLIITLHNFGVRLRFGECQFGIT